MGMRVWAFGAMSLLLSASPVLADEPVAPATEPPATEPPATEPPAPEPPATEPPATEPLPVEDPNDPKVGARAEYAKGVQLVRRAQWSEALRAFEASSALHPNPTTTFNIGACERALGNYARALLAFERALAEDRAAGGVMPSTTAEDARAHVEEMSRILARVTLRIEPPGAAITVDGRPLEQRSILGTRTLVAGVAAPGLGRPSPAEAFEVVLDPGAHVFTLSRKGFADAVLNRTLPPGHRGEIVIALDRLPATLKVTSTEEGALVRVANADVGPAPVDVLRPAGTYRVVVGKDGFLDYETDVTVRPGEEVDLRAALVVDEPSVLERWWFWAGAVAVVAGGVTVTYFATRPDPEPPPYDGGNTGWVVFPQGF